MSSSKVGKVSSVTSEYKWVIENFCTSCKRVGEVLLSPEFSTLISGVPTQWQLGLYPKGEGYTSNQCLSIYLYNLSDANITVNVSFAIVDGNGKVLLKKILGEKSFNKTLNWGFPAFACSYDIMDILDDDKLRIVCKISLHPIESKKTVQQEAEDDNEKFLSEQIKKEKNRVRLLEFDIFERMITEEDKFSDVTFKIGNQTWRAHKCILAKRSSVLATMFQEEIKDNVAEIKNVEPNVFMEFLRYVYSGKVNDIEKIAEELLFLAVRYKLDTLFEMCEETICEEVNFESVVEKLRFAHNYKASNLKKTAMNLIVSNAKNIVVLPSFKALTDTPDLLYEVLLSMAMHNIYKE
ncbi:speckle-type POZ protein B-like [Nasonia vitripennis]|uniref:Uncharacterized protein n=1 Tax=Nasonia vitripennis TaxID=7425 RepID=A0A7M7HH80_NASVI|nr:speckle-type POZ protein B-like [Nasonia vitripennis]